MDNSKERIKELLIHNGFTSVDENTLEELAEEVAESIQGLKDKRAIANTIHGNLVASGVNFKKINNLMGIAENIASSID